MHPESSASVIEQADVVGFYFAVVKSITRVT
nr:hypothetical protein [Candidatus Coxiella mudrowiae]